MSNPHLLEKKALSAIGAFFFSICTTASATTPTPIPPDPVAMAATRALVEQLHLSDRLFVDGRQEIARSNIVSALEWLRRTRPDLLPDAELEAMFTAEVRSSSNHLIEPCLPEATEALAENYARRLGAKNANEVATFIATPAGQALGRLLDIDLVVLMVRRCTAREMQFDELLESAITSNALRRQANVQ